MKTILPEDVIYNSVESHLSENTTKSQIIYVVVLVAFVAICLSLPFIYTDITVQGRGYIRPETERTEVRAFVGEIIEKVYVKENETVKKGDTILTLRTERIDVQLRFQQIKLNDITQHINDLQKLTAQQENIIFMSDVYRTEYELYVRREDEMLRQKAKAQKEYDRNKLLYIKEVIAEKEYDDHLQTLLSIQKEYATFLKSHQNKWKSELNKLLINQSEIFSTIQQLQREKQHYTICAPVSGTVEQFAGIYPGNIAITGQTLAIISPDSLLLVEVYMSPKDIGFIRQGNPVNILVDAFNYNEWGIVRGQVIEISGDIIIFENMPVFKVRCSMDKAFLKLSNGFRGDLKKGMTVRARFVITRRSLFQLLYQKVDDWLNPAQNNI